MGSFQGRGTAALLMMIVVLCACRPALATNYKVGDTSGWTIMSYTSWLSGKTFKDGDTLEFVYASIHNVVEVSEANYTSCSQGSNMVHTDGDTKFTLSGTATTYYICSVPTHCTLGMKLAVPVAAASTTTPTPSPTTTNTTTNNTKSAPPPPPPSSSPLSLLPPFSTMFLILGLSILFFLSL